MHDFGLIGIMYPARSLTYLQWIPRCVPILFVLVFAIFVRMFALICISHIVLSLSAKTGKMLSTLTLSTILFVIFPVIAIVFIPDFKWLSIYPLFHAGAIIGNEGNAITLLVYILMFGIYASIARRHLKHVYTDGLKGQ